MLQESLLEQQSHVDQDLEEAAEFDFDAVSQNEDMPSFLEIMHTIHHNDHLGKNEMCCPCTTPPHTSLPAIIGEPKKYRKVL